MIKRTCQSANDMHIFIVKSENPLKVRKMAVYRSLIPFLVPKSSKLEDLINDRKDGTRNCAVMDEINQN